MHALLTVSDEENRTVVLCFGRVSGKVTTIGMESFQVKLMKTSALLILSMLYSISGSAQVSTSRLEGTIQDSSGAAIPRAKIETVNVKTQASATTTSDGEGHFIFAS